MSENNSIIRIGDVAQCRQGRVGLVQTIEHDSQGYLCKGVHLGSGKFGDPWQSRKPRFIMSLATLVDMEELTWTGTEKN